MSSDADVVEIYTDGACRGNPGPGGWGALLRYRGRERHIKGAATSTTNNRMELTAAIEALGALTRKSRVHIHTDSQYVKNGITEWMANWKKRGSAAIETFSAIYAMANFLPLGSSSSCFFSAIYAMANAGPLRGQRCSIFSAIYAMANSTSYCVS